MCISIFYAQVIGLWLFIAGLAMILNQARFKKTLLETVNDAGMMNYAGFTALGIGLLVAISHNIWVAGWPVVITILAWLAILQGIARLFFPDRFARMIKDLSAKNGFTYLSWFWLIVGLFLIWAGFAS